MYAARSVSYQKEVQDLSEMSSDRLQTYRQKRRFDETPEPSGSHIADADECRFVVHEHHARRLHWDLRLERDGVLKSWAVPKGIPDDPATNHLAVHTEDHPLEYIDFSGEIPRGQYGAGKMLIWDTGTYEAEKFRDDEVILTFHGERLEGRYVLFRTRGDDWMIHRMDPPVDPGREPIPDDLRPMMARLGDLPPDEERWAFEVKWDGVRALVRVETGSVTLTSRTGRDITLQYPELRALGPELGSRAALLDGEIVALDSDGKPSFERLQGRIHLTGEAAIRRKTRECPVTLMLFDVLYLDGHSQMGKRWTERRDLLEGLDLQGQSWRTPPVQRGEGRPLFEATRIQELEGIVAKRMDSFYEPGRRSGAWVKIKHITKQEFVIGGWMPGEGRRHGSFGALLVGYHEDGRLRYAGRVGTGFDEGDLKRLRDLLEPLERRDSPFEAGETPPKGAYFVEPQLVAEVEFREWTSAGILRAPSFKGLRPDKPPAEVVREGSEPLDESGPPEPPAPPEPPPEPEPRAAPAPRRSARNAAGELEIEGRRLRLSNLDKVLYPATGFTKAQAIDYAIRIAAVQLPHLQGRPLTLRRYPDGVEGKSFFEKSCPSHRPGWVQVAPIPSGTRGADIPYCLAEDLPTLVWLANLAAVELHVSLSKAADMPHPTLMVFDLDPGAPADIIDCAQIAVWLRERLDADGLPSVVKTSGSKGLQVYVPLAPGIDYERTRAYSLGMAEALEREHPTRVVSRMTKAKRTGKVLIDWSQNHQGKTTVAVYSLRARPRPTVSTPVMWEEVETALRMQDPAVLTFEASQVLDRVSEHGDLFAPAAEPGAELPD
jgi:bifunctional non-homologous end joining protein LigD